MEPLLTKAVLLDQEQIQPGFFRMILSVPEVARRAEPGQFVQIRVNNGLDPLLPRPISLHDIDPLKGTITLLYHSAGKGTRILATAAAGQELPLWGPLGKGWKMTEPEENYLPVYVAGGIGIAPLLPLAAAWSRREEPGILLYGARSTGQVMTVEGFKDLGVDVQVATEDGSLGMTGRVTDLLERSPWGERRPLLYVCGPKPMLKAVHKMAESKGWACQISLEERMCCGLGACLSCVCKTKAKAAGKAWTHSKVCTDGPVFWSGEVVWDE
ncbi:dihydroorotate dehydrogenase electron transfer subunit [Heliobacterium mobile]|nr:dihydroorotate dehydrogenase electron transfer subunit [Heliobacterium mobile]